MCDNEARNMNSFWGGRSERCFVDVHVLNPLAPSNSSSSLSFTFKNVKRRAYGQRIHEVKHASFTPIIMSATGGWLMKPQFSTSVWPLSYQLRILCGPWLASM